MATQAGEPCRFCVLSLRRQADILCACEPARSKWLTVRSWRPRPYSACCGSQLTPADALTKRFGFADAVSAVGWMGDALWDTWAIAVDACDRLVISAGNLLAWITTGDRRLIAKWSVYPRLFQRLADTATLIMWLQASGIPVAGPLPARDGRLRVELNNVSLGVWPVIDGDLLEVGDPAQVTEAGRMLATLHEALAAYPHRIDGGPSTNEQLVHNDFRSANVLHDGTGITAVLDFEEVAYRGRVADLAKATVLLGTRYHNWGPTNQLVRRAFVAAYHDQAPLAGAEQNELERGIIAILKNSVGHRGAHQVVTKSTVDPGGRLGTAEAIARVVRFVLSADASFVSGSDLLVDGVDGDAPTRGLTTRYLQALSEWEAMRWLST